MRTHSGLKNTFSALLILGLASASLAAKKQEEADIDPSQKVYFSPNGQIKTRILKEIENAKTSIDIAVFNITSFGIESALKKAQKRGVKIRIVTDQGESENSHSVTRSLVRSGFPVKFIKGKGKNGLMHDKFALFDHSLLLTGSYNWTETAERYNYENALFLRDKSLIGEYEKEFDLLWAKA